MTAANNGARESAPVYKQLGGVRVNGHVQYFDRITNVTRVSKSVWTAERAGRTYRIEGGKHAGGSSRQWFLDGGDFNGTINCVSLIDALRLLENM